MYRYLVFGGSAYYASGGCYDLIGKYSEDHLQEALELAASVEGWYLVTVRGVDGDPWEDSHECEWVRVYDLYEDKVVCSNDCGIHGNEMLISRIQDSPVDY